jgi:ubiquitin C-terminal hydrolase
MTDMNFPSQIGLSRGYTASRSACSFHSGDLHGGHYFALIKPDRETRWLKFDDDKATPVNDKEVLDENYGGEPLSALPPTKSAQ